MPLHPELVARGREASTLGTPMVSYRVSGLSGDESSEGFEYMTYFGFFWQTPFPFRSDAPEVTLFPPWRDESLMEKGVYQKVRKLHWYLLLTSGRDCGRIRDMRAVAVVAALRVEISPLRGLLSAPDQVSRELPIYIGAVEGTRVILVRSGVGKKRALAAAELIHSKFSPSGVLSTGFCGGLVPELKPSDVVFGSWIVCDGGEPNWHSKRLSLGNQTDFLQEVLKRRGFRTHVGGFACVSRPVVLSTERSALVHRTGAVVAEMETYHLGEFFRARRIPFVGMRIVVDTVEDSIPLLRATREARLWPDPLKRLAYLLSGRNAPIRLWRFYQNGRRAQVTLRQSVAALIGAWPKTV